MVELTEDTFRFEVRDFESKSVKITLGVIAVLLTGPIAGLLVGDFVGALMIPITIYIMMFSIWPFILKPRVFYRAFSIVPFVALKLLSTSVLKIGTISRCLLSIAPGMSLRGNWFVEENSEIRSLATWKDLLKFVFIRHWQSFFLFNVAVVALGIRIVFLLHGDPSLKGGKLSVFDYIAAESLFLMLLAIGPIMALYFSWVWVWDDAELKIASTKMSSKGPANEVVELTPASRSVAIVFGWVLGFSMLLWLGEKYAENDPKASGDLFHIVLGALVFWFVLSLFFSGPIILMGVMYYQSGTHEDLVNRLRAFIKEKHRLDSESPFSVCQSFVVPADQAHQEITDGTI